MSSKSVLNRRSTLDALLLKPFCYDFYLRFMYLPVAGPRASCCLCSATIEYRSCIFLSRCPSIFVAHNVLVSFRWRQARLRAPTCTKVQIFTWWPSQLVTRMLVTVRPRLRVHLIDSLADWAPLHRAPARSQTRILSPCATLWRAYSVCFPAPQVSVIGCCDRLPSAWVLTLRRRVRMC